MAVCNTFELVVVVELCFLIFRLRLVELQLASGKTMRGRPKSQPPLHYNSNLQKLFSRFLSQYKSKNILGAHMVELMVI